MTDQPLQPINDLTPAQTVEQVIKLEALSREVETKLKEYRAKLLEHTRQLGVETLKTETYTLIRAKRKTIKITNDKAAIEDAKRVLGESMVMTKTVLDMDYMKDPLKHNLSQGIAIEGVELVESEYIQIRFPKSKGE